MRTISISFGSVPLGGDQSLRAPAHRRCRATYLDLCLSRLRLRVPLVCHLPRLCPFERRRAARARRADGPEQAPSSTARHAEAAHGKSSSAGAGVTSAARMSSPCRLFICYWSHSRWVIWTRPFPDLELCSSPGLVALYEVRPLACPERPAQHSVSPESFPQSGFLGASVLSQSCIGEHMNLNSQNPAGTVYCWFFTCLFTTVSRANARQ